MHGNVKCARVVKIKFVIFHLPAGVLRSQVIADIRKIVKDKSSFGSELITLVYYLMERS